MPRFRHRSEAVDVDHGQLGTAQSTIRSLDLFNHRQSALIIEAVKTSGRRYTIKEHQNMCGVGYQTARTDLLDLANRGVLELKKKGKKLVFRVPSDIGERLERLDDG